MEETPKNRAHTPEHFENGKFGKPKEVAAGIPGIYKAVKHVLDAMGPKRAIDVLFSLNQFDGMDCPGCAWPDPDDERSGLGEYCENGAKAIAEESTTRVADVNFFNRHSVDELSAMTDYELGKSGRLTHPMIIRKGDSHYTPISWDQAFQLIGNELNELPSPDQAIFYTSGRTSNEAAFLYQLFVRKYGTNNLPDCSNMCHESSGVALSRTLGIGKGSVKLEDFYEAEVIIISGQNPGTNHPRMLSALQKAKKNGAYIISINPLPETGLIRFKNPQNLGDILGSGTALSDLFLQVRINGDVPLVKAILAELYRREQSDGGIFDWDFIRERTENFDAFIEDLQQANIEELIADSGVPRESVMETVDVLARKSKIIACWAMGLTQHKNGVENIQELVNLLLIKGSVAKPGAGTCPVRGHSNVQGDRTMGIWEKPPQAFLDRLEKHFSFQPPQKHGYDTVEAIEAMHSHPGHVFFAMGGNFLSATPDTDFTAEALSNCRLTVHVSTKPNRSHLVHGDIGLILPCLGRTDKDETGGAEQFVTVENSMGVVHQSRGKVHPVSDLLLSEPEILVRLAQATLSEDWSEYITNYDRIREAIEAVIPGFENYNERVRQKGGFYLPNTAREGNFRPGGTALFTVNPLPEDGLKENELRMMTIRSHDQFNTTIYGMDDRYRGIFNERRVILMNRHDLLERGMKDGDVVDLFSTYDDRERTAPLFRCVEYDIPIGNCATYFPEANVLVPIHRVAKESNTPVSKLVHIRIERHREKVMA
jgi:molybdopterin-dependent oxidoreductase alpha subunit